MTDFVFVIAIELSKDGKWMFIKACSMPLCHPVVHLEVKMCRFPAVFQVDRLDRGGTSVQQGIFFQL